MRAQILEKNIGFPSYTESFTHDPRTNQQLLQPLLELAKTSDSLIASSVGVISARGGELHIPRFIFMGPKGGGDTLRLGLFSTLHGDEPEGAEALVEFLKALEGEPEVARGYHLYVYPICNAGGFAAGTPGNVAGRDLALEFWSKSYQSEIYYLERELGVHRFQGVVLLHTGKASGRFLATTSRDSSILDAALTQPALHAARAFAPGLVPDDARNEPMPSCLLTGTDELRPAPFEINFRIPRRLPGPSRIHGTVAALKSILDSYRTHIAHKQNL